RTFITWLNGRLAADVYISAPDNAKAAAIRSWLRERGEVQAILSGGRAETQLEGQQVELFGLPDHALYRERWPLLEAAPRAWAQLVPGDAAFVSEQLSRRLNLRVGDVIEIPAPGRNWVLDIAGIYAHDGNPTGEIAVNVAALIRRFPQTPQTRIGLIVPRDVIPGLITALQKQFALDDRSVADQATVKAESIRIFNRTFAVTGALNAFTLGVAGIALLTSLPTLAN